MRRLGLVTASLSKTQQRICITASQRFFINALLSFTATSGGETYDCGANNPCTAENAQKGQFYFPHADPTQFVQCSEWGTCHIMNCPTGMKWDQATLQCLPTRASGKDQPKQRAVSAKNAKRGKLPVKSRTRRRA